MIKGMRLGQVNAYLIFEGTRVILVDAGVHPRHAKEIEKAIVAEGFGLEDLSLIIVTHVHYDHVGALKDIRDRSRAPVLVHRLEKEALARGSTPFPKGTHFFTRLLSHLANRLPGGGTFQAVEAEITFDVDFDLAPYGVKGRVIHTPGHTPGSASVHLKEGFCIVGDTLFHVVPWSFYPPFAEEEQKLLDTWQKLSTLGVKAYLPGHGRPIDADRFQKHVHKKEGGRT